ncbi:hypothetical protein F441_01823 [Phytophthora nicotianae CJ01A1]|uniref:Uncharacterized protein n=4 Tax=Phytophthora nicotianae TaxID=4792 RepID=W2QU17_PHYN3|nr:hypothetical protein PPTG_06960 [Phytophthora nicotianae INRA-310]ETK95263.1 hypothetical protein L915_01786 [Phytophthora nicotianae]ETP25275.1 hypothetical protein F441_01823 [Phytophthora nicotianae CJ01A1]ETP53289.1 hypothetical protein F442_01801 [Phytophthora nicotianae P10297]ETL48660.1 hypothetical protein L916_01751 [Phytophthora nicotianae]ETN15755.1 hypothetical protein PPTG_06960 [Phytophthora nicotianae INRA-310]
MISDVTDGVGCGIGALLESWRLLSLYFEDVDLRLKRLVRVGKSSLLTSIVACLIITKNTLRDLFSTIAVNQVSNNTPLIRFTRLQNQRLVVRGSVRFDWDDSCNRVVRLETKL